MDLITSYSRDSLNANLWESENKLSPMSQRAKKYPFKFWVSNWAERKGWLWRTTGRKRGLISESSARMLRKPDHMSQNMTDQILLDEWELFGRTQVASLLVRGRPAESGSFCSGQSHPISVCHVAMKSILLSHLSPTNLNPLPHLRLDFCPVSSSCLVSFTFTALPREAP